MGTSKIKLAAMSTHWMNDPLWGGVGGDRFVPWLKEAKGAGYEGVTGLSGDFEPYFDNLGELKKLLGEHGLGLAAVLIYGIDLNYDYYRRVCAFMGEMGCGSLMLIGGIGKEDGDLKNLACVLDRIGEIAKAYGVGAVYHNHSGNSGETFGDMERLLSYTDPKKVGVMVDTGHATCDFRDLPDAPSRAVAFLKKYWERISCLEFKDFNAITGLATPVGEGDCDFFAVAALLKEKNYTGWITVEQNGPSLGRTSFECIKKSREYIRKELGL